MRLVVSIAKRVDIWYFTHHTRHGLEGHGGVPVVQLLPGKALGFESAEKPESECPHVKAGTSISFTLLSFKTESIAQTEILGHSINLYSNICIFIQFGLKFLLEGSDGYISK